MIDLTDIRWRQRLDNYRKAYHKLVVAVDKLGCMPNQGYTEIRGSRDAIRKALAIGLVDNPLWMETIAARNQTSHNYDESAADDIQHSIANDYLPLFSQLLLTMERIEKEM